FHTEETVLALTDRRRSVGRSIGTCRWCTTGRSCEDPRQNVQRLLRRKRFNGFFVGPAGNYLILKKRRLLPIRCPDEPLLRVALFVCGVVDHSHLDRRAWQ